MNIQNCIVEESAAVSFCLNQNKYLTFLYPYFTLTEFIWLNTECYMCHFSGDIIVTATALRYGKASCAAMQLGRLI
jgi:hypothetical protein